MHLTHEYSWLFSLIFVAGGWWLHIWSLLFFISSKRKRKTKFGWYLRNRTPLVKQSIVSALLLGIVNYIYFYPPALEIETEEGRQTFALFMIVAIIVGMTPTVILDFFRQKAGVASGRDYTVEEDGSTMILDDIAKAREIEKAKEDVK